MTIDESIEYFSTGAKKSEELYKLYKNVDEEYALMIKEDAERSAMVAEWLKELKAYKERMPSYEAGYNDAKKEIALSGEYERAYQRGYDDGYCKALEDSH